MSTTRNRNSTTRCRLGGTSTTACHTPQPLEPHNTTPTPQPHHTNTTNAPLPHHTTVTLNGCGVGVVWLWCGCGASWFGWRLSLVSHRKNFYVIRTIFCRVCAVTELDLVRFNAVIRHTGTSISQFTHSLRWWNNFIVLLLVNTRYLSYYYSFCFDNDFDWRLYDFLYPAGWWSLCCAVL